MERLSVQTIETFASSDAHVVLPTFVILNGDGDVASDFDPEAGEVRSCARFRDEL